MFRSIELKAAIQKSLSRIGKSNGSAPPESSSNTFGPAYELFVASEIRSAANKRYEKAKEAAFAAGVIDEEACVEGAEIATHNNEYFDVTMKKASASSTLDKTMLRNHLMKEFNLDDKTADQVIAKSSKPKKGAVTIGFTLKG